MRLYLSGPMTGLPDWSYPAFNAAAVDLRAAGYDVTNPVDKDVPTSAPWLVHMRADIKLMMDCDGLAILPGWQASRGACAEINLAHSLGLPVHGLVVWLALAKPSKEIA
ncbi:DUF4406 domain-containing protein [Acidovorax sp. NCPPB 4044]|uniref:DUF4406 domain-containing protein n=1 Tax=Acidovorax sp. NCPPB 4044 TaxID=2940490 RepID=UPI00230486AD|nr:DUF4406 domain-containing protein [Acidovorax sp. NCPPB 4044]MDA8522339.1 DUF4406 domain-containing protein [Acidovorax sp. NCPPB 4044]